MVSVSRNIIVRFPRQGDIILFDFEYFKTLNSYNFSLLSDPLGDFNYESVKVYRFHGEPTINIKIVFDCHDNDWVMFLKTNTLKRKIAGIVKKYIDQQHLRNTKIFIK